MYCSGWNNRTDNSCRSLSNIYGKRSRGIPYLALEIGDIEYLVADDSVIQAVFNKVFPDAIRQYCIFHIKKNIKKTFHVTKLMNFQMKLFKPGKRF